VENKADRQPDFNEGNNTEKERLGRALLAACAVKIEPKPGTKIKTVGAGPAKRSQQGTELFTEKNLGSR
jgi:hypothetical protein